MSAIGGVVVLVTGSRDFPDQQRVREVIGAMDPGTAVVVGDARGTDTIAAAAARAHGLAVEVWPADWKAHGRAAGPLRNAAMVARVKAAGGRVLAFWDGTSAGTADCVRRAEAAGLTVGTIIVRRAP